MIRRLCLDRTGSSAVEFAAVLPLLLVLLLGIIDTGRFLWTYNRAEKATQMGARFAVVTNYISPALNSSYVGVDGLTQGDPIPASEFGKITCTSSGCSCSTTPCPTLGTADTTAFDALVARVHAYMPEVTADNVTLEYSTSGLGYAGNPSGPDIAPLVTVKITGLQFTPLTSFLLFTISMQTFTASLTAEDLSGAVSN
jgi:hypothetical protein